MYRTALLLALCLACATAFSPLPIRTTPRVNHHPLFSDSTDNTPDIKDKIKDAAANFKEEPRMNPDRPELPELKGDFDWDAKFSGDDDWIAAEAEVPGRKVLNELELASQVTALEKLETKWRKERLQQEYDAARILGWTERAETWNGRSAMFFLVVGLLTELWTGITIPGQIEEMLRVAGVIGFEG